MNPRALLIDLDGVVRRWSGDDHSLETSFELPQGTIRSIAFDWALVSQAITGRISDAEWRRRIAIALQERFPEVRALEAVEAWSSPHGAVDQATLNVVRWARSQARVALVTNATSRLGSDLAALGILDEFDSVINSAEVGAAKPDRAIFLAALRALGVEAASAIFVDDQQRNVEGAVAMGMLGHTFSTAEALERSLKAHWGTRAAS